MLAISIVTALILAPIVIVTAFFAIEVLAGLIPLRRGPQPVTSISAAIVVPAHDEEAVIGGTVETLKRVAGDAFAILVVADNCTDSTAQIARAAGAEVLERSDVQRRGKGFALAAARDRLGSEPPDVVVIIDADCRIDARSLLALAGTAASSDRACQAVYLFEPAPNGSPLVQISNLAFAIKNLVRQRGLQRLAGRAHLTGTGMALPWSQFATANLGGDNIVEDLALGLELSERNVAPILLEDATIWSRAASAAGTLVQRRRWEGGYLATAFEKAPKTLLRSLAGGEIGGVVAAIDLLVPPLALLVLLNLVALLVAFAAALLGVIWPLIVQVVFGAWAASALLAAWVLEGRRFASAGTLVQLPFYVLWKLPMYIGLARRGSPKEWVRTER